MGVMGVKGRFVYDSTGEPCSNLGHISGIAANCELSSGERIDLDSVEIKEDGSFLIPRVPVNTHSIEFMSSMFSGKRNLNFQIETEKRSRGLLDIGDVSLPLANIVKVKVVGPNEEEVRFASVRLETFGDRRRDRGATTNERGECTFGGYSPGPAKITVHIDRDKGNPWIDVDKGTLVRTKEIVIEKETITDIVMRF